MQINNLLSNTTTATEVPLELKQGEVYQARVKERLSDTEAVLQIRGKEVSAKFEGSVPSGDRVTVQITGQQNQSVVLKTIETEETNVKVHESTSGSKILQSFGLSEKESQDLRPAVKILLDKGLPLSKEIVSDLKVFFDKAKGTVDTKIDTVRALANKRLEVNSTHLRAVHEALHGEPLNKVLSTIAKEIDPNFELKNNTIMTNSQPNSSGQQTVEQISKTTHTDKATKSVIGAMPRDIGFKQEGLSNLINSVRKTIEVESDLQKAISKVKEEIVNNPKFDRALANKINQAVIDAEKLQSIGKDRLILALKNAEQQLDKLERQANVSSLEMKNNLTNNQNTLSDSVKKLKIDVVSNANLQKSIDTVRNLFSKDVGLPKEITVKVEKAIQETTTLLKQGRITAGKELLSHVLEDIETSLKIGDQSSKIASENRGSGLQSGNALTQAKEAVQHELKMDKAISQVRDLVINNQKMEREIVQKVEKSVQEAIQLQQQGREVAGRERLTQALVQTEVEQAETHQRFQVEQRPSEVVKQVREGIQQEPRVQKAIAEVRNQIITNPNMDREVSQKVERAVQEAIQLQQQGRETAGRERLVQVLAQAEVEQTETETRQRSQVEQRSSEVVKQVREAVQQEPRVQKAIAEVRNQIITNPKMDREVSQKVERVVQEAVQLQQQGREMEGRERITQSLDQAEVEINDLETRQNTPRPQLDQQRATEAPVQNTRNQTEVGASTAISKEVISKSLDQFQQETNISKAIQKVQDLLSNTKTIEPNIARDINRFVNQANQLDQAGKERLVKTLQQAEIDLEISEIKQVKLSDGQRNNQMQQGEKSVPINQQNSSEIEESARNIDQSKPSETIQQALKQFQAEPNLEEALNLIRKTVSSNPNINFNHLTSAENAIEKAQQLKDKGREIAARQHIHNELTNLENHLKSSEPPLKQNQMENNTQYDLNEFLQPLQLQSKDFLVTKVTQKLAQATHDFSQLKREISRNLDNVSKIIDTYKSSSYPQAKQMLETTISKLDNAILKSDMMLFTDMRTEKQLLQASSQLADAKKLLAKGDYSEAAKIVGQVKELIDKIIYKPTEQKIMHFVGKESLALEGGSTSKQLLGQFDTTARGLVQQEPSARQMFETIRSMGLNHDSELANSLVFKNGDPSQQQEQNQQNLKAILMKLQAEETGTRVAQQAEQAVNNLTGQQLLSKSDSSGTMQSMLFNLPLLLGGKPENIQVFVNSKNEGQQVDWENCSLYFLLETKRLGDVGVMLTSTDRNLSLTIKNDKPGFREKMEPIAILAKEKLREVGYNVNSISFTRMSPVKPEQLEEQQIAVEHKSQRPVFTEKGMDFKI